MTRAAVAASRRVVVKVGTSALTTPSGRLDRRRIDRFAQELCDQVDGGRQMVCVSSGAIAAGLGPLGLSRRPTDMASLQAAAAVGQSHLMHAYSTAFENRGRACGQVLLTRQDVMHRHAYVNALNTFRRLLALGCVPVVNENDTIATDEIRFGENDLLAALVANLVGADALLLLSDVEGLHESADGPVVGEVETVDDTVEQMATGGGSGLSSGGMKSKLAAAKIATRSGIPVVIGRFRSGAVGRILSGGRVGTLFHPVEGRMAKRKAWIAFATVARGKVMVDEGARSAIAAGNRSLLAAGVRGVEGTFSPGDAVDIVDDGGVAFARGLVGFSSDELARVAGMDSRAVGELVGRGREVVHRDELVVL
ncbi:MAG TPA: glutamate 5-kinase [Actinomycetota bacterium]|nr:glutamate 5-kinase [Actinomycetota bacterium]